MLHRLVHDFLDYFGLANFFDRSIQALTARLNELQAYLKAQSIGSIKKITYLHFVDFVAEFNTPSIHVRKSRVWTLRQLIIS
jgi:integrase/recombinase XerC